MKISSLSKTKDQDKPSAYKDGYIEFYVLRSKRKNLN